MPTHARYSRFVSITFSDLFSSAPQPPPFHRLAFAVCAIVCAQLLRDAPSTAATTPPVPNDCFEWVLRGVFVYVPAPLRVRVRVHV